ncbi:MAG TPA: MaoC family dehydratase, partial [Xanthomonadales bacterium]|nr:MaoC family dehydratase [Xanthomonadales bacterium]
AGPPLPPELAPLRGALARAAAPSPWILVDQARIDRFAACTGDDYWLHVDPARARAEAPGGTTLAHGFLLLSLVAGPGSLHHAPLPGVQLVLNYGLERVRFVAPVAAGTRVRVATRLLDATAKAPGRWLLRQQKTVEIERVERPALVAEHLVLLQLSP